MGASQPTRRIGNSTMRALFSVEEDASTVELKEKNLDWEMSEDKFVGLFL